MLSLRTIQVLGWAMEVAVGSTSSEVLHTVEQAKAAEEIAPSEWNPDNNVRELLGSHRKGKLQKQKASPVKLCLCLFTLTCTAISAVH